jgi:outer membrane immunogenic protein
MGMIVSRLFQTGVAFITLLASPVLAADMSAPLSPPVAPAFSWTGVYFGLNAGWVGADNSMINQATPGADPAVPVPELATLAALSTGGLSIGSKSGFIGGAELGYNYQINNWVAGIEADIQGIAGQAVNGSIITASGTITSTLTGSMDTRWLGTLRGRLGFLPTPTLLVYGTGGLAYGEVAATTSLSQSDPSISFSGGGTGGDGFTQLVAGWTAGGGVEWMFAQNWSAKLEYLHYDLGTTSFTWVATDSNIGGVYQNETTSVHNQGNIVRVGLNCLW